MCNEKQLLDSLNESWDAKKTPLWFTAFVKSIIACYERRKDILSMSNSKEELVEFHEQLMYLNFELGDRYDKCWSEHKLDLRSVLNHLQSCLEYFKKLPEDYKDDAMKNYSQNAEILLQAVTLHYEQLSISLNKATPTQYVELSINLGNVTENVNLTENLEKCDEQDKELFLQQIRCIQLVQLMETMELAELERFKFLSEVKKEQAATLVAARQLATTNKSTPKKSNGPKQNIPLPIIYGAEKERIDLLVYNEVREHKSFLEQIIVKIEQFYLQKLSNSDIVFVQDKFKRNCLNLCEEDLSRSCKFMFNGKETSFVDEQLKLAENVSTLNDIPLEIVNYYKSALKSLLQNTEERHLVKHYKVELLDQIILHCDFIKAEINFVKCFISFLSQSRKLNDVLNKLEICQSYTSSFRDLLSNIARLDAREHCNQLSALQDATKTLQTQQYLVLESTVQKTINDFKSPVNIQETQKCSGKKVLEVIGKSVLLSDVLDVVQRKLKTSVYIEEVRFICGQAFHVDVDLGNRDWHGKNVAVRTKLVVVHGLVVWDVSGNDNTHRYSGDAGTEDSGVGRTGSDGFPGESGGNVLINADQIYNGYNWTIKSNGGQGSRGQDGGDGEDGIDGRGIYLNELESILEVAKVKVWAFDLRLFYRDGVISAITHKATSITRNIEYPNGDCNICALTAQGHEITFSFQMTDFFNCKSYLLYKGTPGKPGKAGGGGGHGGEGGYPGKVVINYGFFAALYNLFQRIQTLHGNRGNDGLGGYNGYNGNNGWDLAYKGYGLVFLEFDRTYYGLDYETKITFDNNSFRRFYITNNKDGPKNRAAQGDTRSIYTRATAKTSINETNLRSSYYDHFSKSDEIGLDNMCSHFQTAQQTAFDLRKKLCIVVG